MKINQREACRLYVKLHALNSNNDRDLRKLSRGRVYARLAHKASRLSHRELEEELEKIHHIIYNNKQEYDVGA